MSATGWRPISEAPKDAPILLCGEQHPNPHDGVHAKGRFVFSGYWDALDEAWCATGSKWAGPFYNPTHWMPLPPPPDAPGGAQLDQPTPSRERAALDIAVARLRVTALPVADETEFEAAIRQGAARTLDKIAALVPDAVKPQQEKNNE